MPDTTNILDLFEQRLIAKGLMIVPKSDWERREAEIELRTYQQKLLRKRWLSFGEIVKGKLLNVTTRQAILYKIKSGLISEVECQVIDGKKKILVTAIKRLRGE